MRLLSSSLLLTIGLLTAFPSLAQKNVIKTRPIRTITTASLPIAPIDLNLTYERVIIPKLSMALTVNYGLERDLDAIVEFLELEDQIQNVRTSGLAIAPEIRFYPGLKKTPRGFYIMGEFFYTSNNLNGDYLYEQPWDFTMPDESIYTYTYQNTFNIDGSTRAFGGAIGLGTQWLFGDHFSVDILWVGLGVGAANTTYTVDGSLLNEDRIISDLAAQQSVFTEDEIRAEFNQLEVPTWGDIETELDESVLNEVNDASFTQLESSSSSNGIEIINSGPAIRLRLLHIAIGVAF